MTVQTGRRILAKADVTPHRSLLPKLGASGYSFPESIAELVDNSIEWRYRGRRLTVRITVEKDRVVVEDDARGMTPDRLAAAMRLAYRDEESERHTVLSQFGVGMKTACASLGDAFRVTSTTKGTTSRAEIEWDAAEWAKGRGFEWVIPVYETPGAAPEEAHGTTITITKLKLKPETRVAELRRDLGQRYGSYLASKNVTILVNDKAVEPHRASVDESTRRAFALDFEGGRVHGWFALLKEGSQKGYYGWMTHRRGRMITVNDKRFGLKEHPEFMKVVGEIHLDFLNVSHNKTAWIEDDTFHRLNRFLARTLRPRIQELLGAQKQAKLEAEVRENVARWMDAVSDALREDDYFRDMSRASTGKKGKATVTELKKKYPSPAKKVDAPAASEGVRAARTVRVRGVNLKVEHRFHPMGVDGPWTMWGLGTGGTLEVYTNAEFPAFQLSEDKAFLAAVHVAEAIAKLYQKEGGRGVDVDRVRERVLRDAAASVLRSSEIPA